jgi:hypothetical protein
MRFIVGTLIVVAGLLAWLGRKRHEVPADRAELRPQLVNLTEEFDEREMRERRGRTGERQELRRRVVHGAYRPIDSLGPPTNVSTYRSP